MSQEITEKPPTSTSLPPFRKWPTSKPGPRAMQPPAGHKPMAGRTEQVVSNDYDPGANGAVTIVDGVAAALPPSAPKKSTRKITA